MTQPGPAAAAAARFPTAGRRTILFLVLILLAANLLCLALALHTPRIPALEWRKGPLIHESSLYGPVRGPRVFWAFSMVFLNAYALLALAVLALPRSRVLSPRVRAGLSLLAALLALGVTEGALRLYLGTSAPGHFRPHPDFFYWNARGLRDSREFPDALPESTDSHGFRGRQEVPDRKPSGEFRVFVVGDSSAFGHGVRDDETFSVQLQRILERDLDRPVRVINAACPGHCTYEGLLIFREMGLKLAPDLLIVSYNNDPAPEYIEEKNRAPSGSLARSLRRLLYRSEYYLVFQRTVQNALLSLAPARRGEAPPEVPRVSLEDYRANLRAFADLAGASGCRVLYLRMPVNHTLLETAPDRRVFINPAYPEALAAFCREARLPLVDVDGAWRADPPRDGFLPGHHFHPSAQGHLLIAEQAADRVLSLLRGAGGATPREPSAGRRTPGNGIAIGYSTLTPLHCALGEVLARTDILARHGLRGTFLPFPHGLDQDEALEQGAVDVTFSCEVPAMIHLDRHSAMQVAGSPGELGEIALLVPAGSGVREIRDLKGRAIAVSGGASAQLLLEGWLREEGLEPSRDVRLATVAGTGEEALVMTRDGRADAAVLWDPWLTRLAPEGAFRALRRAPFWSLVFLDRTLLRPEDGRGKLLLDALGEALPWAAAHREEVAGWVSRKSGLPRETVATVLQRNRFLRGVTPVDLTLEDDVRRRLDECAGYARRAHLVSPDFDLAPRLPLASAAAHE